MKTEDKFKQLISEIWKLTEPVINAEAMELVEIEYRRESHGRVLRFFIDQEEGITIADCTRMSRLIGDLLDVSDLIRNPYHLEVSSPGLNRPLRKPEHFKKHIGDVIEAKTIVPVIPSEKRRRFKGTLVDVSPSSISIDCEGSVFEIPFDSLEKSRLCYFKSQEAQERF